MSDQSTQSVATLQEFLASSFLGEVNAICWKRELEGNFHEIVNQIKFEGNMVEVIPNHLLALTLSEKGKVARDIILEDLRVLKSQGASPVLNIIKQYNRDDSYPPFPTDVYSFHVDRSPIPTSTFLCTYLGDASEILPHKNAIQKVQVPAIRSELKKLYNGPEHGFEEFLEEYFFDLHFQPTTSAIPVQLGIGNLWKLAVDHPESNVLPCIHRAPIETNGQKRLLLIC